MGKVFRPSHREATLLSKIESSKEHARRRSISAARDHVDVLGNAIATKLIESKLIETTNKNSLEEQIVKCLETMSRADDFDIDYPGKDSFRYSRRLLQEGTPGQRPRQCHAGSEQYLRSLPVL